MSDSPFAPLQFSDEPREELVEGFREELREGAGVRDDRAGRAGEVRESGGQEFGVRADGATRAGEVRESGGQEFGVRADGATRAGEVREDRAGQAGEVRVGEDGTPWRSRDRHGRGPRHPQPLGRRARRTPQDRLMAAVEKAVERLGGLGEPALLGVVVRVQRIPNHAEALLQELRAGMRPGPERLWASVGRRKDGTLVVTLHERPILEAVEPGELDTAVYATVLARCAEEIGRDPEQLDPGWGSL